MVVEKQQGALRVTAVDRRALNLGLTSGLTLADARARIPNLGVADADAAADLRCLGQIAELCDRFTPSVALEPPDGIMLDITGCAHIFGDEGLLRTQVSSRLSRIGLSVRASIAGAPDTARALARFSQIEISPAQQDEAMVRPLPVGAIAGLERASILALRRAGLRSIGDLADRPAQVLAARFGQDLVTRLMRTLGREDARITPLRPVPCVVVEQHFAEPFTQMQALEDVVSSLLDDAARAMEARGQGGRVFEAGFFRSDGAVRRLVVQTGRPSRDAPAILKLFHERFETLADPIDPGFGFDCVRLAVPVAEAVITAQPHLDGGVSEDDAVSDLVDRLIVRFGRDRVLRFEARDTYDPDRETRLVSAADAVVIRQHRAHASEISWPAPEPGEPPVRPIQVFNPPQPIETLAEVPDGPPVRFRWRRVLHQVTRAEGPERIAPEWWRKAEHAQDRDYYRVEDAGGCRFWIFREGVYGQSEAPPRWFMHGVFA